MVGVAACGTVTSIKALWETRIRKIQEEEKEEESRRKSKAGLPRRSEVKLFLLVTQRFKHNVMMMMMKGLYCHWILDNVKAKCGGKMQAPDWIGLHRCH